MERVGTPHVDVAVLVGPGQSPATYEPSPRQMARLGHSRVYFRIGVPFEKSFLGKIQGTFPGLSVVDTREGVPLRYFSGSHGAELPDPHIWLDPKRAKIQAKTICEALSLVDPVHAPDFQGNLKGLLNDLNALDKRIAGTLTPFRGRNVYVFHPAFGYFCDSYGLNQVPVEEEGKDPSAKQLVERIEQFKRGGAKVIFVQPQFARKNAEVLAGAVGAAVIPLDPLPRDYVNDMEKMAETLEKALTFRPE